ncbi:MAG: hypothetical protein ACR2KG_08910 [Nocardioidaceae bacterium]
MADDFTRALDYDDAADLARALCSLIRPANVLLPTRGASSTLARIASHLGCRHDEATLVSAERPSWQHVSVHRAVATWPAARPRQICSWRARPQRGPQPDIQA